MECHPDLSLSGCTDRGTGSAFVGGNDLVEIVFLAVGVGGAKSLNQAGACDFYDNGFVGIEMGHAIGIGQGSAM